MKEEIQKILKPTGLTINGSNPADPQINNEQFYKRILAQGSLGLGESYMDGWWDCKELDEFFNKVLSSKLDRKIITAKMVAAVVKSRILNLQTKARSKKVAKEHYDIGNDLYSKMLDSRMQYTCGYWRRAKNLEEAQEHKLKLACEKLQLKKGDKVLELGGGWGGFAKYAAENYGCHVTSYNISKEQVEMAREKCKGLPVTIVHEDYRNAKGTFDKVVSIGMCEHIGYKNYRGFMKLVHERLKPNGLFLLHTIGKDISVTNTDPWIAKYIFPNSMLPSVKQLSTAAEKLFVMEDWHNFGTDYDKTLMAWNENFEKSWPEFKEKYGERFYRMWRYYLLSCAGLFRARRAQLWQIVLSKDGLPGGYIPVR